MQTHNQGENFDLDTSKKEVGHRLHIFTIMQIKKTLYSLIFVSSVLNYSCSDQNEINNQETDLKQELFNSFQSSSHHKLINDLFLFDLTSAYENLEFDESLQALMINATPRSNNGRTSEFNESIIIPYFDKDNNFLGVTSFSGNNIANSGTDYTGIVFQQFYNPETNEVYSIELEFEKGSIVNLIKDEVENNDNARIEKCRDTRDALNCAGSKFEDAECCFEEAACYFAFIPCLAYRIADCIINGCETR